MSHINEALLVNLVGAVFCLSTFAKTVSVTFMFEEFSLFYVRTWRPLTESAAN